MENELITQKQMSWNDAELRKMFGRANGVTATDEEWAIFSGLCRSIGLNPYIKEAQLIPYVKKDGSRNTIIMVGAAGWRKVANSHPQFDGLETEIEVDPKDSKKPYRGTCKVFRKDRTRPTIVNLWFHETKRNDGDYGKWATSPFQMFEKCLKVAGLREAFNLEIYCPEETGWDEEKKTFIDVSPERPEKKLARIVGESAGVTVEPVTIDADMLEAKITLEEIEAEKRAATVPGKIYVYDISEMPHDKKAVALKYAADMGADIEGERMASKGELIRLTAYEVKL